jgi:hypothetical protein
MANKDDATMNYRDILKKSSEHLAGILVSLRKGAGKDDVAVLHDALIQVLVTLVAEGRELQAYYDWEQDRHAE